MNPVQSHTQNDRSEQQELGIYPKEVSRIVYKPRESDHDEYYANKSRRYVTKYALDLTRDILREITHKHRSLLSKFGHSEEHI